MTKFDPGPIADARLQDEGTRATLIFERDFRHAPAKVWAALTDRTQLPKWAPFAADRDLTSEGDVTLEMLGGEQAETYSETILRVERRRCSSSRGAGIVSSGSSRRMARARG